MSSNKKPKQNAFMLFTTEWRRQNAPPNWSMKRCIDAAGAIWKDMGDAERQRYKDRIANGCGNVATSKPVPLRNCKGEEISKVEKRQHEAQHQELLTKRSIDMLVRQAVDAHELESTHFYFIMVNYFTKALNSDLYVPAEIGVAEFSLETGVGRVYHSHANPGVTAFGQVYQTQQYADETHQLPVPPNALGESDLTKIYTDILKFISKHKDSESDTLPPLFTRTDTISIVKNSLKFMKNFDDLEFRIYPIEYLFYVMKSETCRMCNMEQPKSQCITDAYFQRDPFEYQTDIGCEHHEKIDRNKYCAQASVTRWGFTFADYMCESLAIELKPGRHRPDTSKFKCIIIEPDDDSPSTSNSAGQIKQEQKCSLVFSRSDQRYNGNQRWERTNDIKQDLDQVGSSVKVETNAWNDYNNRSASNSPARSCTPTPPSPPRNLDFGICNTAASVFNKKTSFETDLPQGTVRSQFWSQERFKETTLHNNQNKTNRGRSEHVVGELSDRRRSRSSSSSISRRRRRTPSSERRHRRRTPSSERRHRRRTPSSERRHRRRSPSSERRHRRRSPSSERRQRRRTPSTERRQRRRTPSAERRRKSRLRLWQRNNARTSPKRESEERNFSSERQIKRAHSPNSSDSSGSRFRNKRPSSSRDLRRSNSPNWQQLDYIPINSSSAAGGACSPTYNFKRSPRDYSPESYTSKYDPKTPLYGAYYPFPKEEHSENNQPLEPGDLREVLLSRRLQSPSARTPAQPNLTDFDMSCNDNLSPDLNLNAQSGHGRGVLLRQIKNEYCSKH